MNSLRPAGSLHPTGLHPVYEQMVAEWEAELGETEKQIFQALRQAMPDGLTRRQLVHVVFGIHIHDGEDINNSTHDRKIRKTIEHMRDNLIPIFSTSAQSGYKLDISETSISMMVGEWQRRMERYQERISRGQKLIRRIREIGEQAIPEELPKQPTQIGLFR